MAHRHEALVEFCDVLLAVVSEQEAAGLLSHAQRGALRDGAAAYRRATAAAVPPPATPARR